MPVLRRLARAGRSILGLLARHHGASRPQTEKGHTHQPRAEMGSPIRLSVTATDQLRCPLVGGN
jgi:hypothetical protein